MVREWLLGNMLNNDEEKEKTAEKIIKELEDHSINKCKDIGLKVVDLEEDEEFQDLVLSVHHSSIHTLSTTNAFKIIENQKGIAFIQST